MQLNNHHCDTLLQIFQHPTSHNIDWQAVVSLLEAVGTVEPRHDGNYLIRVGGETEVFARPKVGSDSKRRERLQVPVHHLRSRGGSRPLH